MFGPKVDDGFNVVNVVFSLNIFRLLNKIFSHFMGLGLYMGLTSLSSLLERGSSLSSFLSIKKSFTRNREKRENGLVSP